MTKPIAGYLTGMLTLTFPDAEPVEIGSISLPIGVITGPGGITTRLIVDTDEVADSATYGGRAEHCTACHETFTGTKAGEMHRRGDCGVKTGPDRRRCLTADEMLDKGMARNARGHWKSTNDPWTGPTAEPEAA